MPKPNAVLWEPGETAEANAHSILPVLAQEYFDAGRKLLRKKTDHAALHRFRLKTKQFRYTLELFRDVYGASLDRRLELLRPVQSALGGVNDCAATIELIERSFGEGREVAREYLEKRARKKVEDFERLWRDTFDAPGQSQAWVEYLRRVAGRGSRAAGAGSG